MGLVGPMPKYPRSVRFLLVTMAYFTKWVETKPLVHITTADVRKFLYEDIISQFGLPHTLECDNGKHFSEEMVEMLCKYFGIQQPFSAPYHPQANGQA